MLSEGGVTPIVEKLFKEKKTFSFLFPPFYHPPSFLILSSLLESFFCTIPLFCLFHWKKKKNPPDLHRNLALPIGFYLKNSKCGGNFKSNGSN